MSTMTLDISWKVKSTWTQASKNTLWCLIGCSIGDFGTIFFFQTTKIAFPMLGIMILAIINGLITSIMLETEIANVFICGAGAKILGNITIGKNAIIGANAVITKDVAPEAIAVGADQRLVSKSEYDPSESWMI